MKAARHQRLIVDSKPRVAADSRERVEKPESATHASRSAKSPAKFRLNKLPQNARPAAALRELPVGKAEITVIGMFFGAVARETLGKPGLGER
ncbi:MAG TPA: hypothetical protein VFB31_15240 [Pseudolabrys sp.]|nr:hypothetical protein [Pseudolabrys sp.]